MTFSDTLIVGGGLSGLSLARRLHAEGRSFALIEARPRLGGRIHTHSVQHNDTTAQYDLGPAWFWDAQPRIAALLNALELPAFHQYADGHILYEDSIGRVQRDAGFSSMRGSYRLVGGLTALIDALAAQLPSATINTDHRATRVSFQDGQFTTHINTPDDTERTLASNHLVLAIPPRVIAATIDLSNCAPAPTLAAAITDMQNIPTWMAGHAKIVAIYDRPFWRDSGLSGDAMSRAGPMAEIHDASPASGGPYALFGFVGIPAAARRDRSALIAASRAQLIRLFGDAAATPLDIILQDWAFEPETATARDHEPLRHHPTYGLPASLASLCNGRLHFTATETAPQFGGYLEGALEASDRCATQILSMPSETTAST